MGGASDLGDFEREMPPSAGHFIVLGGRGRRNQAAGPPGRGRGGGGGAESGPRADGHWRAPEHRQSPPPLSRGTSRLGKELGLGLVESQGRAQRGGLLIGSSYPGPDCLASQRAQRSTFSTRWGHFQLGRAAQWLDSLRGRLWSDCPLFPRGGARPRNTGPDSWTCSF